MRDLKFLLSLVMTVTFVSEFRISLLFSQLVRLRPWDST
jgi:hypothetical protein